MTINPQTKLCAFVAQPAHHTGSPAMHNAAFQELDLNFVYLAFTVHDIGRAIAAMRTLDIVGYSVSLPYKTDVMQYLDVIDPVAKKIGAVNTVVNSNGILTGYNSDWQGCLKALSEKTEIAGKQVLLVGAGGAGRAIAFGIKQEKGELQIVDLDYHKAKKLASDTQAKAYHQIDLKKLVQEAEILIHATPVGMFPARDQTAIPADYLHSNLVVHDIVYTPQETQLVQDAKKNNCTVVLGYKMLLWQAAIQFELFTGHAAPVSTMEQALLLFLKNA